MALVGCWVKVVTAQRFSVADFLLVLVQEKRVGRLDVVVNQVTWEHTSLTLRKIEAWELILHALWVRLRIIDIENASS